MKRNKKIKRTPAKKSVKKASKIDVLLQKNNKGIHLDIGCGANKNEGFVGMDVRELPGVDIVHNIEQFPYPLPDECCSMVVASHVLEHINPGNTDTRLVGLFKMLIDKKVISKKDVEKYVGEFETFGTFIRLMNEIWRILKPGGRFAFVVPYAGSIGFFQDPTHLNPINSSTLAYFDPLDTSQLWYIYKPYPWKIFSNFWANTGNLEVIL